MLNTQQEIAVRKAVNMTVDFILSNPTTESAEAMARVLLHAFNHHDQALDITDLCLVDSALEHAGFLILKARVHGVEPQELASDKTAFDRVVREYWKEPEPA